MSEAKEAFKILGVDKYEFLKIPATFLIKEDISTLYKKIASFINNSKPDIVFLPFPDRHIDHRIIFDGGVVACRPKENWFPKLSYSMKHYQKHIGMCTELSQVLTLIFLLIFLTQLIKKLMVCLDMNHKLLVILLDLLIQLGLLQNLEEVKMDVILLRHLN